MAQTNECKVRVLLSTPIHNATPSIFVSILTQSVRWFICIHRNKVRGPKVKLYIKYHYSLVSNIFRQKYINRSPNILFFPSKEVYTMHNLVTLLCSNILSNRSLRGNFYPCLITSSDVNYFLVLLFFFFFLRIKCSFIIYYIVQI